MCACEHHQTSGVCHQQWLQNPMKWQETRRKQHVWEVNRAFYLTGMKKNYMTELNRIPESQQIGGG